MKKVLLLVLSCAAAGSLAAPRPSWQFEHDSHHIEVVPQATGLDEVRSYHVIVADTLRVLARLAVNRDGIVTDAWLTDLDRDGRFEIVVATTELDDNAAGNVDVHEWHDFRFESRKVAPLPESELDAYRGRDQFAVSAGRLTRAFPIFSAGTGQAEVPSGELAKFVYDIAQNRWIRSVE